jgi:lipopolysaccharide transport system permease protein
MTFKNELWEHRSLILNFAISDLKIRYKNSVLGFIWTFLEPLFILGVLYLVFSNIFKNDMENYPLYLLLGLIMWNMFSRGTTLGQNSILSKTGIMTQIYFPRDIAPISSTLTSLLMFSFEIIVFGIFMIAFQFTPGINILFFPLIILVEFILILGITFPLSVLNVKFRDVQFIWNVVLQAGFFLTPIFYKLTFLPTWMQEILRFSPLVQILTISHELVLYNKLPSLDSVVILLSTTLFIFGVGYIIFKKLESKIIEEL